MASSNNTGWRGKVKVVIDTNALIYSVEKPVDLLSELSRVISAAYEVLIPLPVIEELNSIRTSGKPKEKRLATLALKMISGYSTVAEQDRGLPADASIANRAKGEKWVVVTNDNILRRALRERGVPVIFIKDRTLKLEGELP